jgi:predicted  nucleic acid-binding Zn-ribbon protein
VYEREVAPPPDPLLMDQLSTLRTMLVLIGLIAVAGLAVAVYTLATRKDDSNQHSGASSSRVSALEDRVNQLEADMKNTATKDDVKQVSDDVQALSAKVDKASSASQSATDQQARDSIDKLNQNQQSTNQTLKDLDKRVTALENNQQSSPTPSPTP